MSAAIELEMLFHRDPNGDRRVGARARLPGGETLEVAPDTLVLDLETLRAAELQPERYGRLLADGLFSAPAIAALLTDLRAASLATTLPIELRLRIPDGATELRALRWERLFMPDDGPLAASERVLLARCIEAPARPPPSPRPKNGTRALVVVAAPIDLGDYQFAPFDAAEWARQAREQLGSISTDILAGHGQATLAGIGERLAEYDILYLVCHGRVTHKGAHLWLEHEDGRSHKVSATQLVQRMMAAPRLPRLVVLVSCDSAGAGDPETLASAIGPALARAGVPAVIAMQAWISIATATALMPPLFRALTRHGRVDRALAAARACVLHRRDWWVPALFVPDGFVGVWTPATENEEREDSALMSTLQQRNELAQLGWLRPRYSPDLHRAGTLQDDLHVRLHGPRERAGFRERAAHLIRIVDRARAALNQLPHHPAFLAIDDAEHKRQSSAEWLEIVSTRQTRVQDALRTQTAFPLVLPTDEEPTVVPALTSLITRLDTKKDDRTTITLERELRAAIDPTERCNLLEQLQAYGLPVLYDAEPGAGKTHALARVVENCLADGIPAVLLRAKEIDPRQSWEMILGHALGRSGTPLPQLLASMDRAAANRQGGPRRLLIALDGLDESRHATQWAERLRELGALAPRWPEVMFAVTTRTHLARRLNDIGAVDRVPLGRSDAPLREVFRAHCEANDIHCPPWLRWALVDPLSIRLFAELYRDHDLTNSPPFDLSIKELMDRKLDHVEATARRSHDDGWDEQLRPVRALLRILARASLDRSEPISIEDVMKMCGADRTLRRIDEPQISHILEICRDEGLLRQSLTAPDATYGDEVESWEPAYQPLTDFLVAREVFGEMAKKGPQKRIPRTIKHRYEIQDLVAEMLTAAGRRIYEEGLWSKDLDEHEREDLQLRSLVAASPDHARTFDEFVTGLFLQSVPGRLRVVELLVVPTLHRDHPFNARFIHRVLSPMVVADRDLLWSGPPDLDSTGFEIWAGENGASFPSLDLDDEEAWHMTPLLLAWRLTSVEIRVRSEARGALARWGAKNPDDLLTLLRETVTTNDSQMLAELLRTAFQAALFTRPGEAWRPLGAWSVETFMVPTSPRYTDDVVVRRAVCGLVERMAACGVAVAGDLERVRDRPVDPDRLLPLDREIAAHAEGWNAANPVKGDLASYVVPNAHKEFFEAPPQPVLYTGSGGSNVSPEILKAFANGVLRPGATTAAREAARDELARRAAPQPEPGLDAAAHSYLERLLLAQGDELTDEELLVQGDELTDDELLVRIDMEESLFAASSFPTMSDQAMALLHHHARAYDLPSLRPDQLAFGFVVADLYAQGWTRPRFYGEPNGAEPGEELGPDVAILRKHWPATHGARSTIATFLEKYVWSACNKLVGFLADRLPLSVSGHSIPAPSDLTFVSWDNTTSSRPTRHGLEPLELFQSAAPRLELSEQLQPARAIEWIRAAPIHYPRVVHRFDEAAPAWLRTAEWVVLRAVVRVRDPDSQAETHITLSGFVYDAAHRAMVALDAPVDLIGLHDFYSELRTTGAYKDIHEVVWSAQVQEQSGRIFHQTLDDQGAPLEIPFMAASCHFYSQDDQLEDIEQWMPAQWLRQALRISDYTDGRFLDGNGEVVAYYTSSFGQDSKYREPYTTVLLARSDRLTDILDNEARELGWDVRLSREPSQVLIAPSFPHIRREIDAILLMGVSGETEVVAEREQTDERSPTPDDRADET